MGNNIIFEDFIDLLYIAFVFGIIVMSFIVRLINKRKPSKKEIKFDEFDDIAETLQQEKHEREQLELDDKVLYNAISMAESKASAIDTPEAYAKAQSEIEKAKRDIKNFRFLDSVDVEENEVAEGATVNSLKENGNNFDVELFKKWSKEIFKCIKSGTDEELNAVKYFIKEELYNKLKAQERRLEKDGLQFVTDGLTILDCKLLDYGKSLDREIIKVLIKVKMKEYIIQKSTNEILRGNDKKFNEKMIVMTFIKRNVKDQEGFLRNCPNCGAEVTQTNLGRCRYCDTLIFPIRYNWTLNNFETM